MHRLTFAFAALVVTTTACGKDDGGTTGAADTTTSTSTTTGTSSESSTSADESTSSSSSSSGPGTPSCPFYAYQQPPEGNVGEPYEYIPEPTDEPKYWFVEYEATVPGLTFGPMISGTPEAEGGYPLMVSIVDGNGGVCQPQMFTLVIGPPLPGDSSTSGTSGDESSGSDSSGSSGTDSGSSSSGG